MKTHHLVIWTIGDGREVPPRAVADDVGRALVFATAEGAHILAGRLADYGLSAAPWPVDVRDVTELLAANGVYDPGKITIVEASTTGPEDLADWATTLADDFVQRLADDFVVSSGSAPAPSPQERRNAD